MSHPFDATLKDILGQSAADLAPILHLPTNVPTRTLNVDLSTVSAATDLALGFGEPLERISDINFQSGLDAFVDARLHLYNAAYHHRYRVPVQTILVLLRPAADHTRLTGSLAYQVGASKVEFQYETVRLWQQPLAPFLTGGLGVLPLAPLCELPAGVSPQEALREVVHRIDQRLAAEAPYAEAVKLMTAAFVLTGLRVDRQSLAEIFQGVKTMHESSAFTLYEEKGRQEGIQIGLEKGLEQGIEKGIEKGIEQGIEKGLEQGRVEESHRLLLRLGRNRFGPADAETEAALRAIHDLDRLERMADAVLTAESWQEFLAAP